MRYRELYLRGSREDIINFIERLSDERGFIVERLGREHIRIYSERRGVFREALRTLFWGGGRRRYPSNYPLLDIIILTPYTGVVQVIIGMRELSRDVGEYFYNALMREYLPYQPWLDFKRSSTP